MANNKKEIAVVNHERRINWYSCNFVPTGFGTCFSARIQLSIY